MQQISSVDMNRHFCKTIPLTPIILGEYSSPSHPCFAINKYSYNLAPYLWFLSLQLSMLGVGIANFLHCLRHGGQRLHPILQELVNLRHALGDGSPQRREEGIKEPLYVVIDSSFHRGGGNRHAEHLDLTGIEIRLLKLKNFDYCTKSKRSFFRI